MFCVKCGARISDGSKICDKCGTTQSGAPDYEYKTVRCYPSEYAEERYRDFYENCGWKVTDMDRRQTYAGQTGSTQTYSTQTHIKLQRDKNMPYYEEIRELSEKAERYFDTSPNVKSVKFPFILGGIAAFIAVTYMVFILLVNNTVYVFELIPTIVLGICAVAALILGFTRKTKNKKIKERYYSNKKYSDEAYEKCKQLVRASRQY